MKERKVGFFGGGFDPIHLGHIYLALQIQEKKNLDEILLVPAYCSPFKWGTPPKASNKDRLCMVELVTKEFPNFSFLDWEIFQEKPSYTVDTLQHLKRDKKYREAQIHLILTEEGEKGFSAWKEAPQIMAMAKILVGTRYKGNTSKFTKVDTKIMEVCSSEIRERIFEGRCVKHLLLSSVLQYIEKRGLYKKSL